MATTFADMCRVHGTDKLPQHGYHRFYPDVLERFRGVPNFRMLEVGIAEGRSLRMWLDYFATGIVYAFDIEPKYMIEHPRCRTMLVDQSDVFALRSAIATIGGDPLPFIIDDGSHVPTHQLLTFDVYFADLLADDGVYIIEDVETSYWRRGMGYNPKDPMEYGYRHPKAVLEVFKHVLDFVNRDFMNATDQATNVATLAAGGLSLRTLLMISTVTFGQNCVIVRKKATGSDVYAGRPYQYGARIAY